MTGVTVLSEEAVEQAARAMYEVSGWDWDDMPKASREAWYPAARAALAAALPVIERDLRERIAGEVKRIEGDPVWDTGDVLLSATEVVERVRSGGGS